VQVDGLRLSGGQDSEVFFPAPCPRKGTHSKRNLRQLLRARAPQVLQKARRLVPRAGKTLGRAFLSLLFSFFLLFVGACTDVAAPLGVRKDGIGDPFGTIAADAVGSGNITSRAPVAPGSRREPGLSPLSAVPSRPGRAPQRLGGGAAADSEGSVSGGARSMEHRPAGCSGGAATCNSGRRWADWNEASRRA